MKTRLDQLVVERGLADSRVKAQGMILAGEIWIGGQRADKAGHTYAPDTEIEVRGSSSRFVGRGGEKLEGAFTAFDLDVAGLDGLDVGASTGGFTDCLLQHGAARVVALDVGHGQLHQKLRDDSRVTVMEKFNARFLKEDDIPYRPMIAVTDVSFISLTLILPPMVRVLLRGGHIVALIKPQFEAGREQVGRGGVVRDPEVHRTVVDKIRTFGTNELSLECLGIVPSPLLGPKGNVEFLSYWKKNRD